MSSNEHDTELCTVGSIDQWSMVQGPEPKPTAHVPASTPKALKPRANTHKLQCLGSGFDAHGDLVHNARPPWLEGIIMYESRILCADSLSMAIKNAR